MGFLNETFCVGDYVLYHDVCAILGDFEFMDLGLLVPKYESNYNLKGKINMKEWMR